MMKTTEKTMEVTMMTKMTMMAEKTSLVKNPTTTMMKTFSTKILTGIKLRRFRGRRNLASLNLNMRNNNNNNNNKLYLHDYKYIQYCKSIK